MNHFSKRTRWVEIMASLPILLGLTLIAGFFGLGAFRMVMSERAVERENEQVLQKLAAAQKEKKELEAFIRSIQSPETIERIAKEKLNLKNPGEEAVILVSGLTSTTPHQSDGQGRSWVPTWLASLFSWFQPVTTGRGNGAH